MNHINAVGSNSEKIKTQRAVGQTRTTKKTQQLFHQSINQREKSKFLKVKQVPYEDGK